LYWQRKDEKSWQVQIAESVRDGKSIRQKIVRDIGTAFSEKEFVPIPVCVTSPMPSLSTVFIDSRQRDSYGSIDEMRHRLRRLEASKIIDTPTQNRYVISSATDKGQLEIYAAFDLERGTTPYKI
jgi:hypothetical protein